MSFTDIFILGNDYIRPYTVCGFLLSFVLLKFEFKGKTYLKIVFCFIVFFTILNIIFPSVLSPDRHFKYVLVIVGVAFFHIIIISQALHEIKREKAQKFILYSILLACILAITESFINIVFGEFSYPFRESKADAVILVRRSYAFATEPSNLGAFIITMLPFINLTKYSSRQVVMVHSLVLLGILSTLSVYIILVYALYYCYKINSRYLSILLLLIIAIWNIIPDEIFEVFRGKILLQGSGSSAERLDHITVSINASLDNLVWGLGWGAETEIMESSSHNFLIGIFISNGIIGVLLFAFFLFISFCRFHPRKSYVNKISWESIVLSGCCLLTSSSFYEPNYMFAFAFVVAYGHVRVRRS